MAITTRPPDSAERPAPQPEDPDAPMTLAKRSDLVLAAARALFVNGQTTDETMAGAERVAHALRLRATLVPRWGELQLQAEGEEPRLGSVVAADPSGVHMIRAASIARTIEDLDAGRLAPASAMREIDAISHAPPLPTWLFAIATGAGAFSLAMIFGLRHANAAALIFVSAGAGGIMRRHLARVSTNLYLQPLAAALLAGVIGALAVRWGLSSPLRLVAICPCLVLVPGPHLLNGALDLFQGRIHLGGARTLYAGLVLVAITTGLLLGLALLGEALTIDPPGTSVPLWRDMIFAAVVAACYGIYFSMPLRMLAWPVAVGALAHALRWVALTEFDASAAIAVLVASIFVGLVITPIARRRQLPFAAIGFASVVSMLPGSYITRTAAGFVKIADGSHTTLALVSGTIADGTTAILIILAMGVGLIGPKLLIDRVGEKTRWAGDGSARPSLYG